MDMKNLRCKRLLLLAWLPVLAAARLQAADAPLYVWPADCPIKPGERVLFLGDSIVAPGMYAHVANALVDELCADQKTPTFFSYGVAGATAQSIVPELSKALKGGPYDWILLNYGQNDSGRFTPEQFREHAKALLAEVRKQAPQARLGWISVAGTEPTPYADEKDQEKRAQSQREARDKCAAIAAATKALCAEEKILYVPLHEKFEEVLKERDAQGLKVCFTMDGVHPNLPGNWLLGAAILQGLGFQPDAWAVEVLHGDAFSDQGRLAMSSRAKPLSLRFDSLFLCLRLVPPPVDELVCAPARKPVVLDGDLAEWDGVPASTAAAPLHVTMELMPKQADRYAASVRTCHDEKDLFFAFDVREPDLGEGTWFPEIIEVFLDGRKDRSTSGNVWRKDPGLTQFCFHRDFSGAAPAAKVMVNGDVAQGEGVRTAVRKSAEGYTLEAAIPLTNFKQVAVKSGTSLPLDWAVSFTDQAINLDWLGLMSRSSSTRGYGQLRLE